MKPQSGSLQTLVVWAALAALAGFAAILTWQWSGASANWVAHTLIVQQQLVKTLSTVQDIETTQRGYILTGDASYLQILEKAQAELPRVTAVLGRLVRDNPEQSELVQTIRTAVDERLRILDESIALARAGETAKAIEGIKTGRGKDAMGRLRSLIEQAQHQEQLLFEDRQSSYRLQRVWMLGALLAVLVGCAGLALVTLLRERERVAALEQTSHSLIALNKSLEERVAARTGELAYERDRAEAERERAEALLRDVTHRIGNTLGLVVGFINLHIRHTHDPLSIKTLTGTRSRIHAIASAQRRINVTNDLDLVRIDTLISAVLSDLVAASEEDAVSIDVMIEPLLAPAQAATSICVLTQEFVVNSLKHAFPDGRSGRIEVTMEKAAEGGALLTVVDNGVGLPTGNVEDEVLANEGLGSKIATLLTRQFNGKIIYAPADTAATEQGTRIIVTLPDLKLATPEAALETA